MSSRKSVAELEAKVAAATDKIRRVSELEKQKKDKLRSQMQSQRRRDQNLFETAFMIFAICAPNNCAAMQFLHQKGFTQISDSWDETVERLENKFLNANDEDLIKIYDLAGAAPKRGPMGTALKFLRERELVGWVELQNAQQGVAPSYTLLLEEVHQRGILLRSRQVDLQEDLSDAGKMKWCQRFRRRWHLSMANMQQVELLPPGVLREKVPKSAPKTGRIYTHFQNSECFFNTETWYRKTAPILLNPS